MHAVDSFQLLSPKDHKKVVVNPGVFKASEKLREKSHYKTSSNKSSGRRLVIVDKIFPKLPMTNTQILLIHWKNVAHKRNKINS